MNRRGLLCGLFAAPALVFGRRANAATGIPAILHPTETILTHAQRARIAGNGLTTEQVAALIKNCNETFVRNIGPMVGDWQRRHG